MEGRGDLLRRHRRRRPPSRMRAMDLPRPDAGRSRRSATAAAFYPALMDECTSTASRRCAAGGFYGGWITERYRRPVQGGPRHAGLVTRHHHPCHTRNHRRRRRSRRHRESRHDSRSDDGRAEPRPGGDRGRAVQDARLVADEGRPRRNSRATGRSTAFAPTDAAFAKAPQATLAAVAKNKADAPRGAALPRRQGLGHRRPGHEASFPETLEVKALSIRVSGGKVMVGGATVIKQDVTAPDGVMHVINKVLIPDS